MASTNSSFTQLETTLEEYLVKKAPALPENIKEFIVKFAPWLTLIFILLLLPAILALLGLGTILLPFSYLGGVSAGFTYTLSMIISVITLFLEALAIPGLFKRELKAWRLVFYATLVNALSSLFQGNIIGAVLSTLISLYILFQVKSYYK
jgi:hypothetical protein